MKLQERQLDHIRAELGTGGIEGVRSRRQRLLGLLKSSDSLKPQIELLLAENLTASLPKFSYYYIPRRDNPKYHEDEKVKKLYLGLHFGKYEFEGPFLSITLYKEARIYTHAHPGGEFVFVKKRTIVNGKMIKEGLYYLPPFVEGTVSVFKNTFHAAVKLSHSQVYTKGRISDVVTWDKVIHPYALERSNPLSRIYVLEYYGDKAKEYIDLYLERDFLYALVAVYKEAKVTYKRTIKMRPFDVILGRVPPKKVEGDLYLAMPLHPVM